ncbi:MAG: GNAT family N-acetyltransferase [Saprospiraceae bacterium]|nr:GNAT family N-acetyltransferase [Saprospiraceae bacterium]HRD82483.1 GNAT family N-acetyltransferase [Saprospiraceae bacterium]
MPTITNDAMKHPAPEAVSKPCAIQSALSFLYAPVAETAGLCRRSATARSLENEVALPLPGWTARVFSSLEQTPEDWDLAAPSDDIFLQRNYLTVMEQCAPEGMAFAYVVFYKQARPVGLAYAQLLDLRIKKSLESGLQAERGWFKQIKSVLAGLGRFQLLVCGNMLLTGAHGFHFSVEGLREDQTARLLDSAMEAVSERFRCCGRKVDLAMVKDISPCCKGVSEQLSRMRFSEFSFQPNMILHIQPSWQRFDDYLEAMSSKYRVRARRAFKKMDGITRRELTEKMVVLEEAAMYELYCEVAAHADFNAFDLHPGYFTALKQAFPQHFRVFGYYQQDELVGFCTTMRNGHSMEAHFLGFRNALNASHQLYLNMLYDMAKTAIESGASELVFARTAMEIKSSIGAEPQQLDCRLRHYHGPSNRLMPFFIRLLEPSVQWVQRHPFRAE